jgi:hypothetical protein
MPLDSFDLDSPCGRHFKYRDFIECSETWRQLARDGEPGLNVINLPRERATLDGIRVLCDEVLDPVWDRFGPIELTYGFSSAAFARRVRRGIAPALDQHAGAERARTGRPICARGGQAVDFRASPNTLAVIARFVATELRFDRLYYYGPDRPFHVSAGPDHSRQITILHMSPGGYIYPRRGSSADFE